MLLQKTTKVLPPSRAPPCPVLVGRPANRVPPTHLASQVHHSAQALPDKSSSSEPIKAMLERLPSNPIRCQSCDSPKHCLARNSSSPERSKATPTFTDKTGKGARVCRPPTSNRPGLGCSADNKSRRETDLCKKLKLSRPGIATLLFVVGQYCRRQIGRVSSDDISTFGF